jgi:hypothetical protein
MNGKAAMHQQIADFQQQLQQLQQEARVNSELYTSPAKPRVDLSGTHWTAAHAQQQAQASDGLGTPAGSSKAPAASASVVPNAVQVTCQHSNDVTRSCHTCEVQPVTSTSTKTPQSAATSDDGPSPGPTAPAAAITTAAALPQYKRQPVHNNHQTAQITAGKVPGEPLKRSPIPHAAVEQSALLAASGDAGTAGACMIEGDGADRSAMTLAQQLAAALPAGSVLQTQLSSLMQAIASGMQERKALAAQGQLLLGLVVGDIA